MGGRAATPSPADAGPPEPVEVERPVLVTSGLDAYWREEPATENPDAVPNLEVDEAQSFQNWYGFGGAFTESGWEALSLLDAAERQHALELLFDPQEGAHFVWGRVPIGADGYALERYTHDEVPGDWGQEEFSLERDHQYLIPYLQAALEIAPDLRLWAVPWTPPTWMKNNGSFDGGSLKTDSLTMNAYARYLVTFLEAYKDLGIEIEALLPQADPEFEFNYPSCLWTEEALLSFVRDYLQIHLLASGLEVDVWLGAFAGNETASWIGTMMEDPAMSGLITGFGLQWGALEAVPLVSAGFGWPVMQTEHKPGNFPYLIENFDPERAPNDHGHALESWDFIRSWVEAGVNSYSAWNMVLDTVGTDLDVVQVWPKSALLTVDRETRTLAVTPAYYVFRHLSFFVEPGAVRLGTKGGDALAFQNPDGAIATVVFNPDAAPKARALSVKGTVVEFTVPAQGWATLYWE